MGFFGRSEDPPPTTTTPVVSRSSAPVQAVADATVIARSCRIEGTLSGSGDVNIQGRFKGEISGSGQLLISETGDAEARLHARSIVVAGKVHGDMSADEKIELKPSANLRGNITAPRILIQEGATFEGQVFMKKPTDTKGAPAAEPKPKSSVDSKADSRITDSKVAGSKITDSKVADSKITDKGDKPADKLEKPDQAGKDSKDSKKKT